MHSHGEGVDVQKPPDKRLPDAEQQVRLNAVEAVLTGTVAVIVTSVKFFDGAWLVMALIPMLVGLMSFIHRQYAQQEQELRVRDEGPLPGPHREQRVIVPVNGINRAVVQAVNFGRALARDIAARTGAAIGLHRFSLTQLAARLAQRRQLAQCDRTVPVYAGETKLQFVRLRWAPFQVVIHATGSTSLTICSALGTSTTLHARTGQPVELSNIDPARLPPAYRGRIQKYFQKLSEK